MEQAAEKRPMVIDSMRKARKEVIGSYQERPNCTFIADSLRGCFGLLVGFRGFVRLRGRPVANHPTSKPPDGHGRAGFAFGFFAA